MVHKPKHRVHSFRGLLADGGEDEINLERQNVNLAYRIVKFEAIPYSPGLVNQESVLKIYRESQSSIDALVDFSTDPDLIGVVYLKQGESPVTPSTLQVIFDNVLFSRNIYVTHKDASTGESCNYYLEIEEVPVGAATLMQIKLGSARKLIGAKMGG